MAKKFSVSLQSATKKELTFEMEGRGFNDITSKLITGDERFRAMIPNGLVGIENLSTQVIKFFKRGGSSNTLYPVSAQTAGIVMMTAG